MSQAAASDFPVNLRRAHDRAPPLRLWIAVLSAVAALLVAASLWAQLRTPFPADIDDAFFHAQMRSLAAQEQAYRKQGQNPVSVVFIGTSRMKNVTVDWRQVAASAAKSGVQRPVANTYIAINWGGFQRLAPAVDLIEKSHPDVVVVMPELFFEDFSPFTRELFGFRYFNSMLWHQHFTFFSKAEFYEPVCTGESSAAERLSLNGEWMAEGTDLPGPAAARDAVDRLARAGIAVIIADVPVSASLAKLRPRFAGDDFFARAHVRRSQNVDAAWIGNPLPQGNYCDWAHIAPAHADLWQRAFLSRVAPRLNGR